MSDDLLHKRQLTARLQSHTSEQAAPLSRHSSSSPFSWHTSPVSPQDSASGTFRSLQTPGSDKEIAHGAQLTKIASSSDPRRPLPPQAGRGYGNSWSLIPGLPDVQPSYRPTRSLLISRRTSISQLRSEAALFGDVQQAEQLGPAESGTFSLTFFDIRAAQAFCESFNQLNHESAHKDVPVSPPAPHSAWQLPPATFIEPRLEDASRGSLLVSGLDWVISAAEARRVCSDHGATCYVWGPIPQPHTPAQLVAFLDTRAARCAYQQLRGKLLEGRRLLVERVPDPVPSYAWPAVPSTSSFLPQAQVLREPAGPSSPAARTSYSHRSSGHSRRGEVLGSSPPQPVMNLLSQPSMGSFAPASSPASPGVGMMFACIARCSLQSYFTFLTEDLVEKESAASWHS